MPVRILLALVFSFALLAQKARELDPVKDVPVAYRDGAVVLQVPEGAHLKSAFMTVALKKGLAGRLDVGPLPPTDAKDELGDGIWHGTVAVPVKGQGLTGEVELEVTYQPCTEGDGAICYPPQVQMVKVGAADLMGSSGGSSGSLWAFLAIFAWGLVASLTPCVYPMIPIIMAVVGASRPDTDRRLSGRGFLISLSLVLGMAVTYTALGVVAAISGAAFGSFAQRPSFLIPLALLFTLFGASLLGAFEIRLPAGLQARLQSGPRRGILGAFLMGLVLGPISAPCVGPVVGTILLAISRQGQVLLGALQLFTFALGMGVLFMAVGTFSASLPRSGPWLVRLKQLMGLVVLGFAVWTVRYVVPGWLSHALWAGVLLIGAAVLGAFRSADGLLAGLGKGLAFLALAVGLLLGVRAVETGLGVALLPSGGVAPEKTAEAWRQLWLEQDYEGALARAQAENKLVVIDVWAEWCAACHELDEKTWPDPAVSAWIKANAVAVRIDTDKVRKDLGRQLEIVGYPTVLVLDGDGKVLRRREGFQRPADMLAFLSGGV